MTSFSFGASFTVGAWIVPLFTQSEGFSAEAGAAAGSLILFGGILTRPLGGALVRRRPGLAWPIMVGSVVVGAVAVLALNDPEPPLPAAALVVGLAGLPYGATTAGVMAAFPGEPGEAVAVTIAMSVYFGVAVVFLLGLAFGAGEGLSGSRSWRPSSSRSPRPPRAGARPSGERREVTQAPVPNSRPMRRALPTLLAAGALRAGVGGVRRAGGRGRRARGPGRHGDDDRGASARGPRGAPLRPGPALAPGELQ